MVFGWKRQREMWWHISEVTPGTARRLLSFAFFLSFLIWQQNCGQISDDVTGDL